MKTNLFSAGRAVHARTTTTTPHLIFRRAWIWTGLMALATIAFEPQSAQAAVTEAWVQRYGSEVGSGAEDSAHKVVTDAAGSAIVAGSTFNQTGSDMLVIKYSSEGVPLWTNRYHDGPNDNAEAWAAAVGGGGNVFVTGSSVGSGNHYDYATIAYSGTGVPLWTNRYGGLGMGNNIPNALAVDGGGNVFVTGYSVGSGSSSDYATIAYSGAGVPLWTNRYNGSFNGDDQATSVAVDGSGNVFVTGSSVGSGGVPDYATIAYSGAGVPLWTNRYGRLGSGLNRASAVAVDGSGNVFVTGSVGSGSSDYATIAYSGAGVVLWTNLYNGPANRYDEARAVAVDGSGNVFVTGYSVGNGSSSDYATIAYSSVGVPLWTNRYNGPANGDDIASALAVDGRGNVVVTGEASLADYATILYSGAGVPLWTNRYNGPANEWDSATAVAVDGSGNVFVTGSSSVSGGSWDYATIAYSGAGVPLWTNRYDEPANGWDRATAVAVDGSGNVFVTGSSRVSDGNWDYATIAYSGTGVPLWTNRGPNQTSAVAVDDSGNVFVTGSSWNGTNDDLYTAKYAAADGALLWEKRYNQGYATSVTVDARGNVVVTGSSEYDFYTAKYAAADGALLWERRYSSGQATSVAVDGRGNVVVTGNSYGSGRNSDYATIAYSDAGVPLWTNRYNGPFNGDDRATAVAVDAIGNVVVTGSSDGDYYTAKYSGADGSVLWQQRYNGPADGWDEANAVAVDASGNVVVTGMTGLSDGDYYTAKYAAADGALLWEKRYNGPANSYDEANAVAVDGSGNVVVTGHTDGFCGMEGCGGGDYYTVKYAAADGATLWEKRYNGPLSSDFPYDPPPCLALGPSGMIVVGGTSSRDYATVVYREVPTVSIELISTGVRLRVTGVPGVRYNIERAPAVTGPWSTINTQAAPGSGLFEYHDTNRPVPAAFYRTSEP